ncbi:hypothetical protein POF50_004580 [Streptomyces sp. SL13]|uniref:Uncharacterized protein n=1 Tax=Streptantibioticus silvisoli TaxID=2705255 RepID=A0AA90H1U3_9ACTN|nr:hypothetical protein [Streptantibioticus silvisoli]MDI5968627.1 hypothetical protein [Streptantibioticus silvisoli]
MRITDRDDVNHGEALRVTLLGVRIAAREARGKDTRRLENRQERILDRAARREADNTTVAELTAAADLEARALAAAAQRASRKRRR